MEDAWIALFGAIFGGVGLKVIEAILNRSRIKLDAASELRNELREQVDSLRRELSEVRRQLDAWKDRYYVLMAHWVEMGRDHQLPHPPTIEQPKKGDLTPPPE